MAPKVLISDSLSEAAVQIFKDRGIEVDFQSSPPSLATMMALQSARRPK